MPSRFQACTTVRLLLPGSSGLLHGRLLMRRGALMGTRRMAMRFGMHRLSRSVYRRDLEGRCYECESRDEAQRRDKQSIHVVILCWLKSSSVPTIENCYLRSIG